MAVLCFGYSGQTLISLPQLLLTCFNVINGSLSFDGAADTDNSNSTLQERLRSTE